MTGLRIEPIAAFADNYIWMLRGAAGSCVTVVDPGDARPVLQVIRQQGLELGSILITHHHQDHIGGVAELRAAFPQADVIAPQDRRIPLATHHVGDGDVVQLAGVDVPVEVLAVPGHTSTHLAYRIGPQDGSALFCGDTLFSVGCGRVFDGTMQQLAASLRRLAQLPATTQCYCAHEYTVANIGFARRVERENLDLAVRAAEVAQLLCAGQPSVPSTLELELATNPFLRVDQPSVIAAAEAWAGERLAGPTEVFTALRRWKDRDYD